MSVRDRIAADFRRLINPDDARVMNCDIYYFHVESKAISSLSGEAAQAENRISMVGIRSLGLMQETGIQKTFTDSMVVTWFVDAEQFADYDFIPHQSKDDYIVDRETDEKFEIFDVQLDNDRNVFRLFTRRV